MLGTLSMNLRVMQLSIIRALAAIIMLMYERMRRLANCAPVEFRGHLESVSRLSPGIRGSVIWQIRQIAPLMWQTVTCVFIIDVLLVGRVISASGWAIRSLGLL